MGPFFKGQAVISVRKVSNPVGIEGSSSWYEAAEVLLWVKEYLYCSLRLVGVRTEIGRRPHFVGNNLLGQDSAVNCTSFRSDVSGYTVNSSLPWRFDCLVVKIEKLSEITGRCWYWPLLWFMGTMVSADICCPWTERRTNVSVLEKVKPKRSPEATILRLKLHCFGHVMRAKGSLVRDIMIGQDAGYRR